ncbi:MAG: hypothetical protein AB7E66_08895 [Parvibaculaceae bacterium]
MPPLQTRFIRHIRFSPMPICEADPWRMQYFERIPCPEHVRIPTEDADAWSWYPEHRWIYDKLQVALSQGLEAAPHGVEPSRYPVFSKPIVNLKGMGVDSRIIASREEFACHLNAGHMWMELLEGEHVSTDCAVEAGRPAWWRHTTGVPTEEGMFDHWMVHAEARPQLESYLGQWVARHFEGYSGLVNFETIGERIIEVHLRFADQWTDLYGPGWVEAAIRLYETGRWSFDDRGRQTGYSVVLFGRHGPAYRHPPQATQANVRAMANVSSLQVTFHEDRPPEAHAMPPGGFRLAIVNATDLEVGQRARLALAACYPGDCLLPLSPNGRRRAS